ncbi:MAG TPA: hypothetical protein PLL69_11685, partial [Gemmatimonadales bacterium]|nr:hypothetical protein [Gemmatimonadales bacterium]
MRPGIATRTLTRAVDRIWLGTSEAQAYLPPSARDRITVTGAPIIPPDQSISEPARARLGLDGSIATIVITGGSQGSLALNRAVAAWIAHGGGSGRQIIWATGRGTWQQF